MKGSNNNCVCDKEEVKKGHTNPEFVKRHDLSENSHPTDWFKAFLSNRVDEATKHGTGTQNTFTNLKGLPSNLGYQNRTCSKFKPLSPIEMMVFVGLAVLDGLMPSTRFECTFKIQMEPPVTRNESRARIFG